MGCINKVILLGNVGQQPTVRTLQSGSKCATFSLATNEPAYTLKNGTQVAEQIEWHDVIAWGSLATLVEKFVGKGIQIYVEGKIKSSKYTDKNGIERTAKEIVADNITLLRNNIAAQENNQQQPQAAQPAAKVQQAQGKNPDDNLPF